MNNLDRVNKSLKSIVKRCKSISYSTNLVVLFAMLGVGAFSEEVAIKQNIATNTEIKTEVEKLSQVLKRIKNENSKKLEGSRLELVQLMERGDQVVKSPWSSWQFGMNFFYGSNGDRAYKGLGDKREKYAYEGKFARSEDILERTISLKSEKIDELEKGTNIRSALTTNREGLKKEYGLVKVKEIIEPIVDVEIDAGITPRSIDKQVIGSDLKSPEIALPSYQPRLVVFPKVEEKEIKIDELPVPVPIVVGFQDVPGSGISNKIDPETGADTGIIDPKSILGFDKNGSLENNGIVSELNLVAGEYNVLLKYANGEMEYDFKNISVTDSDFYNKEEFKGSISGTATGNAAFYGIGGGKENAIIGKDVVINAVGKYENDQAIPSIFYLGNIENGKKEEAKITQNGVVNVYGDNIAVVNIDNVSSPKNITFVNNGKITGFAKSGEFMEAENTAEPKAHIFGAFTYGDRGEDKIENSSMGEIKFYAPNSIAWAYTSAANQNVKRSAINNGKVQLYGKNSLGITLAGEAERYDNTQVSWANIQLNKPIEIYGDSSIGVSISNQWEDTIVTDYTLDAPPSTSYFNNSKLNIKIGGDENLEQDATYGDTKGNINKVENSVGLNFDFESANNPGSVQTLEEKELKKWRVELGNSSESSAAIRLGKADIVLDDSDTFSKVIMGGNKNVGFLADKSIDRNTTAFLKYKNINNSFEVKGNEAILFAAKDGAKLEVLETLKVNPQNITSSATNFTLAYSEGADSKVEFKKGINGEIAGENAVVFYSKDEGTIDIAAEENSVLNISGKNSIAYYTNNGGIINASNNKVKVTKGMTLAYSDGNNSKIDLTGANIEYSGDGLALYTKNSGSIDLTNGTLTLKGKATAFEKDLTATTNPITLTNAVINAYSNDVIITNFKNYNNPLKLSTLKNDIYSTLGSGVTVNNNDGTTTYDNYKLAAIDGISAYNIDADLVKSVAAQGNVDENADTFTKKLLVQKAKLNLLSGKKVEAHLNSTEASKLGSTNVIGLEMNSSSSATSNSETEINLQANTKVSADRTDTGNGAVGLYINYGKVNIEDGATLEVEKTALNGANAGAVGVYAVNGSEVTNKGDISVGGENSIGILALSYRKTENGDLVVNEFGDGAVGQGSINVTNEKNITLDGKKAVAIYVSNNDKNNDTNVINAKNKATAKITLTGEKAVGMAGDKFTLLENEGTIDIQVDSGIAMLGATKGSIDNKGTINLGDSSSEKVIRTGIFTADQDVSIKNTGTINVGKNSYGIFGKNIELGSTSTLNIGENGVGLFSTADTLQTVGNNIEIAAGAKFNIGNNNAVGLFTGNTPNGIKINDAGSIMNIGENSFGYVFKGKGTDFTNVSTASAKLGKKAVYLYSDDTTANIKNNVALTSTGDETYGLYSAGTVTNRGNIDFSTGIGNVGIYSIKGGTATNYNEIKVGASKVGSENPEDDRYSIAMAAGYKKDYSGNIINEGTIDVEGNNSIGMFASGDGSIAENKGTINLKADNTIGMYITSGAEGINKGTIQTVGNPTGVMGVVIKKGGTLTNEGTINIDSVDGYAIFKANGATIKNYGNITLGNGTKKENDPKIKPTTKELEDIEIIAPAGSPTAKILKNKVEVTPVIIDTPVGKKEIDSSSIGMYVDTLRGTNPINGLSTTKITEADLIIGVEASENTTSKYIQVRGDILEPYNKTISANPQIKKWNIYSGALTWIGTPTLNPETRDLENLYLAKIPYTAWSDNKDTHNFADGLEQRYGVEALNSRENKVFKKLNSIGNNEEILLYQAYDEMMGHQYANTQQRIHATGLILDKEFRYLKDEWKNVSKSSNKLKVFGMHGEYRTETAGVIDYSSNAYGVAYMKENETIKLGESTGWYTGLVQNKFNFKDIGKSKEEMLQTKLGLFKSMAFDDNNSLNARVSGEAFLNYSKMNRRYLVVDEIFAARSKYWAYGFAMKNELTKDFRLTEATNFKVYGGLKAEYGRVEGIKERNGEIRLEVKSNDYLSIQPELGAQVGYKYRFANNYSLNTKLNIAYENELGRLADGRNKAKVAYTNADWFRIRGEKEDRRGNVKTDLSIGLDNQRYGITANLGYDTKGSNKRLGLGLRVIF